MTTTTPSTMLETYVPALTPREIDVLELLAQHYQASEIAALLVLSENTIKTHMRTAYAKLQCSRRGEAVRTARALGLIDA